MAFSSLVAKHLREVHFGKNWTWVDLKTTLEDVDLKMATTQIQDLNTIATLVCHMHYYVERQMAVLAGGPLEGTDKDSFATPDFQTEAEWQAFLAKVWADAETLAQAIEQLPDEKLHEIFVQEKYGTYYRNLTGVTEHFYYHMGQIVLLKKLMG
ncbi:MAG: DUF1572 family protein [Chitinophagales bacterium]|nr:DUF1572 family protein [Chitinophagales bacterium]